MNSIPY